jgi:hypothetical protein
VKLHIPSFSAQEKKYIRTFVVYYFLPTGFRGIPQVSCSNRGDDEARPVQNKTSALSARIVANG